MGGFKHPIHLKGDTDYLLGGERILSFMTPLDLVESHWVDGPFNLPALKQDQEQQTLKLTTEPEDKEQEVFYLALAEGNSNVHNIKKMLGRLLYALISPDLLSALKWCCQKEITSIFWSQGRQNMQ